MSIYKKKLGLRNSNTSRASKINNYELSMDVISMKSALSHNMTIEESKDQEDEIFGQEMNFEITVNSKKRAGLDGIPEDVETWLLSTFTKQEIMDDPEKVI